MIFQILSYLVYMVHAELNTPGSPDLVPRVDFYPAELLGVEEYEDRDVFVEFSWRNTTNRTLIESSQFSRDFYVTLFSEDTSLLEIANSSIPECIHIGDEPHNFSFTVRGVFLGYTNVKLVLKRAVKGCEIINGDESVFERGGKSWTYELLTSVIRQPSILINGVTIIFAILVAINFINMGVQLDLDCIKSVLRKPIGPAIGFFCQFLFMPLVNIISFHIHLLF
ncbi:p3 protein [Trichonephila inaurata madagascariensis]|uniref:p3 protein n=1 Tax=Trichonephila inaurata madagascariensis TaxID=2747483 RepID=A0A8X6YJ01_9ARAC|nr:p3 protein [Trichonephila inaurata madagascariensis]GFY72867.1 p3 protein [Trichonephila inaurata madagascariensis]